MHELRHTDGTAGDGEWHVQQTTLTA
jgi:hypothetical protein